MREVSWGLVVGVSIGVAIGALLATAALLCARIRKRRRGVQIRSSSSLRRDSAVPMRGIVVDVDAGSAISDSITTVGQESPTPQESGSAAALWMEGGRRKNTVFGSGIPKYSYKDLQKATSNFTTVIGQGAFGSVYKAQMSTNDTVAVKMLAANSKQGEKEFQTEVLLLGRLHHRNLVNLVGYCAEKGQHILVYVYMANGSLASHLYSDKHKLLNWNLRINIALDVARGLEYLHDGAVPPVVHRDIKSANILLDGSMKARVADFGLSREEMVKQHASNIRGTFGYLDPEYVSSRSFTKKSDVYSFGVLLFELIAGRNPQQGLMEYVELAAINAEGRTGWEEIVDPRLDGIYDLQEINDTAALAYKCVNRLSRKRPSMRDVVQALSRIVKETYRRKRRMRKFLPITAEEGSVLEPRNLQTYISEHRRVDSVDSYSDFPDV